MQELTDDIHFSANGKIIEPDGLSAELFKIALYDNPALRQRLLDIVVGIWTGVDVPQQWKDAIIKVFQRKGSRWWRTPARFC